MPQDVPIRFRVLPEFMLEDVIDYLLFIELSGENELVIFALTFLTSTWYIKNPFLKTKLVEVPPSYQVLVCHWGLRFRAGAILWDPRIWPRAYR